MVKQVLPKKQQIGVNVKQDMDCNKKKKKTGDTHTKHGNSITQFGIGKEVRALTGAIRETHRQR